MTSLINNYINNTGKTPLPQNTNTGKIVNTNVEELDTRNFLKPLKGQGHLVKGNIFDKPGMMVKDAAYNTRALKHAIKGNANDHELGKINDMGMFLGGLGIAAYLFTKKQSPMTKAMEFVGLGSFFAAMAIWPKIAIQLPAQIVHGVNVQQDYIDSFGRKKKFHLDPQFKPWDLYTEEKIYKYGDRLGVPKNIPNRRAFIQEKINKIATQCNTIWMWSAGFATAILSGLLCNVLEKPVRNGLNALNNYRADQMLERFPESIEAADTKYVSKNMQRIIETNKGQIINDKLFKEILSLLADDLGPVTKTGIEKDLRKLLFNNKYDINTITVDNLLTGLNKQLKGTKFFPLKDVIIPKKDAFVAKLTEMNLFDKEHHANDIGKISRNIMEIFKTNILEYNKAHPESQIDWTEFSNILNNKEVNKPGPIVKGLTSTSASRMTPEVQASLKSLAGVFDEFNSIKNVLCRYAYLKVAAAPETALANYWNNTAETIVDLFKITPEEIKKTRYDSDLVYGLIREKMTQIATSSKEDYTNFMKALGVQVAKINDIIKSSDGDFGIPENKNSGFMSVVDSSIDSVVKRLKDEKLDMPHLIERLVGIPYEVYNKQTKQMEKHIYVDGSYKNTLKGFVSGRMLGVESSFMRLINAIDLLRRISTGQNAKQLYNGYAAETKEELVEAAIRSVFNDHSGDFATKGYTKRSMKPVVDDRQIHRDDSGRVIYRFLNNIPEEQKADIPTDAGFFQEKLKLIFENPPHEDTTEALKGLNLESKLQGFKSNVLNNLGDDFYFAKPYHYVYSPRKFISSKLKFNICGISITEMFYNLFNQKYNTNKWFKVFGGFAAGLTAVTVGSQFFLGRMKNPEPVQKG